MNESTAAIRNPERWQAWARSIAVRGAVSRRRRSMQMRLALPAKPVFVLRSSYLFASSPQWSTDLTFRLQSFANRTLRNEAILLVPEILRESRVEKERGSSLQQIEQPFKSGPVGRGLAILAARFTERTRRIEERVASAETVTVVRGRGDSRNAVERADVPMRGRWPEPMGGRAPWGRSNHAEPQVPALNVERITENVMRQIDHRLTAWRERTGRN